MSTSIQTDADPGDGQNPARSAAPPSRHPLTLPIVLLAVFVVPTSISGTAVALPEIGATTGAGSAELQWVVNAFNVAFACFTLMWGSLADIIGRIRAFTLGAAVYAVASLACATAPNIYVLDAARALAGLGGAAIFACGSAIISTAFDGPARAKAFALFGSVAGIGVALGPSLSGPAIDAFGWRSVFGIHAAALAVVLAALPAIAKSVKEPRKQGVRLDIPGTLVFILAMLLLTTGIVEGSQLGWAGPGTLALLAGSAIALGLFAAVEKRRTQPLLDLSLLRNGRFLGLCLVPVAASFGFVTMLTYLPTYLSEVASYSTTAAGLTMVLLTLPVLVLPLAAAQLVSRGVAARTVIQVSLACLVVGDLALLVFGPDLSLATAALPMLVTGAGMGLSAGLVDGQALEVVDPAKAGMAAGFLNTLRLGSEAVAVAVYGSLIASLTASGVEDGVGAVEAYDSAFHTLVWAMAAVCLVLFAVIPMLLGRGRRAAAAV